MTIELFAYKELVRTFTGQPCVCKQVRVKWLKEIKNLTGIYYIIIKP